jgi:hypothetical protein
LTCDLIAVTRCVNIWGRLHICIHPTASGGSEHLLKLWKLFNRNSQFYRPYRSLCTERYSYFGSTVKQGNIFHFFSIRTSIFLLFRNRIWMGSRFHALRLKDAFSIGWWLIYPA